jgi:signal peptidase II
MRGLRAQGGRRPEVTEVPPFNRAVFCGLAFGGAALDLFTKWLAFAKVGPPGSKRVIWQGVLSFTTSYNKGALWGLGRDFPYANFAFAGLSVIAAAAILYWLFWRGAARDGILSSALGLIMAGTVGNCYDRLMWGQVRDFIYFELINWPIFNMADSMLVCGAGVLMLQAVFSESSRKDVPAVPSTVSATSEVRSE